MYLSFFFLLYSRVKNCRSKGHHQSQTGCRKSHNVLKLQGGQDLKAFAICNDYGVIVSVRHDMSTTASGIIFVIELVSNLELGGKV